MLSIVFFMLGLVGLWLGAELITKSALGISRKFNFSESFIGLIVISIGTSLPEIMVTLAGALEKSSEVNTTGIVMGNIIGSNLGNMAFILGLTGLLGGSIKLAQTEVRSQGLALVFSTLMFLAFASDGRINKYEGLILISAYIFYFFFTKSTSAVNKAVAKTKKRHGLGKLLLQLIIGLIVIAQASDWVINSAIELAVQLGINQLVIGVILVGIGTSLPELVVSVTAFFRGARELSVGNLLGSNIVNTLLALGLGATISDWEIDRRMATFDLPYLLFVMIISVLFMFSRKKLERKESLLMIALYTVYISLKLIGW